MTVSVVIVNYNTRDLLRDCLQSLVNSSLPAEIIVVDNASSDGSAAMVADEFPDVTLLAQSENTWFCGGNNMGVDAATGDYVLLLNPDTVVPPDALEMLVNFMETHPDYAGTTAQMRYPDGSLQRTCSRIPTYAYLLAQHTPLGLIFSAWRDQIVAYHWYEETPNEHQNRLWGRGLPMANPVGKASPCPYRDNTYEGFTREQSRDVEVLPGSCLLMRRADIWLDDDLLLYFPEDDLARRFAGRKFRFITETCITHREKSATQSWLATRVYFRDLLVYTRKHHGLMGMALLWLLTRPMLWGMWVKRVKNSSVQ